MHEASLELVAAFLCNVALYLRGLSQLGSELAKLSDAGGGGAIAAEAYLGQR
ncbi:MAG: hypothetical protein R3B96_13225 [Pirellulaceae bacterium]